MALTRVSGGILQQPIDVGIITATSIQVGSGTTIHDTGIDLGSGNITSHNINSTGIITATSFVGPVTGNASSATVATNAQGLTGSPSITVTNITASGNVSIAGTLTYEDVTNIDSVGIVTARAGINVTGGSLTVDAFSNTANNYLSLRNGYVPSTSGGMGFMSADHSGANADGIAIYGHDGISLYTAQTERLRVASNGLVGIGTTAAQITSSERLSVNEAVTVLRFDSTITGSLYLRNGDFTVGANNPYLVFQDTQGNRGGIGIANTESVMFIHGQNGIRFRYNGTSPGNKEAMRFDSNGRVSIGTDSGGTARAFRVKAPSQNSTHISLIDNDSTQEIWQIGNQSDGDGFMQLLTDEGTAAIKFDASGVNHINGGNLGIGTDNPSAILDVVSNHASAYIAEFRQAHASNTAHIILDSPTDGASRPSYMDYATGGTVKWTTGLAYLDTHRSFHIGTGAGLSNSKLIIKPDGKTGIGTYNPESRLQIHETISSAGATGAAIVTVSNFRVNTGSGAAAIRFKTNEISGIQQYKRAQISAEYDGSSNLNGRLLFATADTSGSLQEGLRIDSNGRALLGKQKTYGGGTYYDDLTINNSNTDSGAAGGAGIDLVSGNDSWGGYIFSDSDNHARGYLKYDHGDDEMIFGTSSANRVTIDSDGRLLVGGSSTTNPINANNTFALQVVGSYTNTGQKHGALFRYGENSSNSSIIRFEKNRSNVGNNTSVQNGDNLGELQFYGVDNTGAYKLGAQIEVEVDGVNPENGTVPTRLVFKTTPVGTNQTPIERFRITRDGGLRVENSDYNDLIGCTGEHSGPSNSQYKTNSKVNLSSGTWYTIAVLPSGRGFASFMIQDLASSRHTCFYFNAGHQYGGSHTQNCINVIGASGTHSAQVFGAVRIKAYGTYDGAMLQVYIQNTVSQVQAYMVGENLAPQRWRMRDWIADGTDPTGLSNWASINTSGGTGAYADLNRLSSGGASFSGHVLPGLDNTYSFGSSSRRWGTVYATSSSINTSDITLKRDISVLNDAEMRAAARISKKFKQYRWNDSYAEKGDDARYHSGVMAQTVRDEMLAEGLDPTRYGFYCVDTWYEDSEGTRISKFYPAGQLVDEDDPAFNTPDVGEPEIPANMSLVTGYSLRYEELLCFIAAYNEQRFTSLESRLSALES